MNANVKVDYSQILAFKIKTTEAVSSGLLAGGEDTVELASQLAPKDTGELSDSGKAELKDIYTVEISFGNDLPDNRAVAQEYGTVFQPAQPYLTPAVKEIDFAAYIIDRLFK